MNVRALIPAALAAAALSGCSDPYASAPATTPSTSTTPPRLPEYSREQVNRQDHSTAQQRHREQAAMEDRPMLDHLPLEIGDVEISVYGLAADDRHTVLQISAPDEAAGRDAYRAALRSYGDRGTAYETRYVTP